MLQVSGKFIIIRDGFDKDVLYGINIIFSRLHDNIVPVIIFKFNENFYETQNFLFYFQ